MSASNIYDRARAMVAQSARPVTLSEALAALGKRGARARESRRPKKLQPVALTWYNDPER